MAEALAVVGLVANITQFVELGKAIVTRISDFCQENADTPAVFRNLLSQLSALVGMCEQHLESSSQSSEPLNGELRTLWAEALQHTKDVQDLVFRQLPKPTDSLTTRAWKATKSVGLDGRLESYLVRLESFKTSLILSLAIKMPRGARKQSPGSARSFRYLPTRSTSTFVGREEFLGIVEKTLQPNRAEPSVCVLLGLGGQGKTSLALEYCRRQVSRGYFSFIIWFDVTSTAAFHRRFSQIADELSDFQRPTAKPAATIHYVKSRIQDARAPWLIVFDNYDQIDNIPRILDYVPGSPNGAVLITSRHSDCAALGPTVYLSGLQEAQAIELLLNRAQIKTTPQNIAAARDIVTSLGFLPLAIEQSAAFISSRRLPLADFAALYRSQKKRIMASNSPFLDYRRGLVEDLDDRDEMSRNEPLNVWTTWELSFEQIGKSTSDFECDAEALKSFLTQLAFFNKSDVRMQLFKQHWKRCTEPPSWMPMFVDEDDQEWDDFAYQECLFSLQKLSLIQYQDAVEQSSDGSDDDGQSASTTDRRCVSMHTLVRDWIQLRLAPKERSKYSVEALKILSSSTEADREDSGLSIGEQQELLTHLDASTALALNLHVEWTKSQLCDLESCLESASWYFMEHGWYMQAEKTTTRLLNIRMTLYGATNKATLSAEITLSTVHLNQGKYKEVELRMKTALARPDFAWHDVDEITCQRLLAFSLFRQGRYDESAAILTGVLESNEPAATGVDHHAVLLDAQELLAQVYRMQGRHEEARRLYGLVLSGIDTRPEKYAPTRKWHCMVHLANSFRDEAIRDRAAELYKEAIEGLTLHLGPNHPSSLSARLFFAILESDSAVETLNFDAPRGILQDVIERLTKVLGPEHVDTIKAMSNLAILQHRAHQPDEAERLFRKVLAAREKQLGRDNPYTLRILERLVGLLWAKGQAEDAEKLALQGLRHSPSTPSTPSLASRLSDMSVRSSLRTNNSSATTLVAGGQSTTASAAASATPSATASVTASEQLFRSAWRREELSLHEAHPTVIDTIESLVVVCKATGQDTTDLTEEIERRRLIKHEGVVSSP